MYSTVPSTFSGLVLTSDSTKLCETDRDCWNVCGKDGQK